MNTIANFTCPDRGVPRFFIPLIPMRAKAFSRSGRAKQIVTIDPRTGAARFLPVRFTLLRGEGRQYDMKPYQSISSSRLLGLRVFTSRRSTGKLSFFS